MDPQFLLKDEVEFELACRGYTQPGLVSALKNILKRMLEAESLMEVSYEVKPPQSSVKNPSAELDVCTDKIGNIMRYVSELNEKPDKLLYKRLVSRLFHLVNRLKFVTPVDQMEKDKKNALLNNAVILLKDLEGKDDIEDNEDITPEMIAALHNSIGEDSKKILSRIDDQATKGKVDLPATSKTMHNTDTEQINVTKRDVGVRRVSFAQDDFDIATFHNLRSSPSKLLNSTTIEEIQSGRKHKLVPISQWGVHFYGDNKFSVNAFIERVEELRDARNATDEDLWRHAIDFFKGNALIWFRANRMFVGNWNELVLLLKRTFQSPYYQEALLTEAKARTQGKNEPVLIFIAVMQNMFNRLPNPILESEKLMIIVKNLQPYYQRAVCRDTFTSLLDLVNVLRIIERTKVNCDNFQEPKVVVNSLEPDLAYKSNSDIASEPKEVCELKNKMDISNINMRCWNCRETGHLFRSCPIPKQRLFCYRCGRFGITLKDCSCKGNASGESSKPAN
ncbi:jg14360 [Pararge aegeria aegeria]|uniref:Jg14360 protein n=1 Tax=Pararge aegeria aegeria TaxID=348720 RepID=A0A8S4QX23_9NEOP|nr:jg14360 [Pararge aegeria aegeria]